MKQPSGSGTGEGKGFFLALLASSHSKYTFSLNDIPLPQSSRLRHFMSTLYNHSAPCTVSRGRRLNPTYTPTGVLGESARAHIRRTASQMFWIVALALRVILVNTVRAILCHRVLCFPICVQATEEAAADPDCVPQDCATDTTRAHAPLTLCKDGAASPAEPTRRLP